MLECTGLQRLRHDLETEQQRVCAESLQCNYFTIIIVFSTVPQHSFTCLFLYKKCDQIFKIKKK